MTTQRKGSLFVALLILIAVVVAVSAYFARVASDPQEIRETVVVETVVAQEVAEIVTQEVEKSVTQEVEAVIEVQVPPTSPPLGPKTLVICQAQEPDTLYEYGGNMQAASYVKSALGYDLYSFFTSADFAYQPVALEDLPTLENGGVVLEKITINPGDAITYSDPTTGAVIADTTALNSPLELDQIAMTFKIRPGLMWEDGVPITAADYELSFNLYMHPDTPNPSRLAGERTAEFTMLDDTTQVVKLLPGLTPADYIQYMWDPMPAHILGDMAAGDVAKSSFARSPLSFGPFKMAEWVEGQYIRVIKNENYWREGYPKLDEVIFKFVPDANQLLAQLLSGECDMGTEDGLVLDQSPFLDQAQAQGILVPYYTRDTVWEHIDFGITSVDGRYQFFGPSGYTDLGELDLAHPGSWVDTPAWEAAKSVRKAFAVCIDRQQLLDEALYGHSILLHTIIPENHPLYPTEGLVQYAYNPALGRDLLAAAGWTETDGDDFLDRNGIKFQVTLNSTVDNPMREIIAQRVQENLRLCGVDVVIELLPNREYFGDGPDGTLFGRSFDLGEFAWLVGVAPRTSMYYCDQWPAQENDWSGSNNPGYCNPAYDALGKQAEATLNRAEQKRLYAQALAILSEDLPVLPLFQRVSVSATRPGVLNYKPNPTIDSPMWNIWEWDIE